MAIRVHQRCKDIEFLGTMSWDVSERADGDVVQRLAIVGGQSFARQWLFRKARAAPAHTQPVTAAVVEVRDDQRMQTGSQLDVAPFLDHAVQAAAGMENGLRIRVCGALGTLEWAQEHPQQLLFKPLDAPAQIRTPRGPGTLPLAQRSSRIAAGHPEGYHEALANLYAARRRLMSPGVSASGA